MLRKHRVKLKTTALDEWHRKHGAKMAAYDDWLMPSRYRSGKNAEHNAVRTSAGLFDVSNHGLIVLRGKRSEQFLNYYLSGDVSSMKEFDARFHLVLNPRGGIIDGVYLYRLPEYWFMSTTPGNQDSVYFWFQENIPSLGIDISDATNEFSLFSLQGPNSATILESLISSEKIPEPKTIGIYRIGDIFCKISRTGFTGEDGFEIFVPRCDSVILWEKILETAAHDSIQLLPAGQEARESLRFEAGFPSHGKEMTPYTTPVEAGLGDFCDFSKNFLGKDTLLIQMKRGTSVRLATIELTKKKLPGSKAVIADEQGTPIGSVVASMSSTWSGKTYCNGFISSSTAKPGTVVKVLVGKRMLPGTVVERPLYKRNNLQSRK